MLLSTIVSRQGHRVLTAANGLEAVALFEQERPQLVLMDALMPVMDGFEAARAIKAMAGDELVPIIFLTSLSENEALVRCLEAGGDDFIAKPYNPIVLQAKIKALHRLRRLQATVLEQRDLIARRNQQLLDEQRAAKAIFDKVAHAGGLDIPNVRYRQSPRALFNGDLLLAAQAPAGQMFVLLGDFTGHGLPAAIGAMPLAETFYGMTAKGHASGDILRELNGKLKQILPVEMFCCVALLDIDFHRRVLRVWNGGLPDGYLIRADGSRIALRSRHLPLGVLAPAKFDGHCETYPLQDGDRLLLLSDGVVESRNARDELFGEQRLLEVLERSAPEQLFDRIEQALAAFHGQAQDDLSLVEVTIGEPPPRATPSLAAPFEPRALDWVAEFELRADSLRTANPLPLILQVLLQTQPLRPRAGAIYTVLAELYSNALEHGVLALDSAIKRDATGFAQYYELRRQRLADLRHGHIRLRLQVHGDEAGGCLRIGIRDSGAGFDVVRVLAEDYRPAGLGGRGLRLVRQLSDSLEHDGADGLIVEFRWGARA
ncbi:ATP-binding SpoIIE family protein phosphatase [Pseudomonas oligotrophica]|uniref:ATP-binding SpoIIE family protein phosphatase n=1 Tax=Pseudomonas oligotrophica TaxID=2912055 RepID=UPI001F01ADC1|nr:SpoIIE family protein phosphatase [Pseudomonas oligotrophica]MCF7202754.1 SpoIIE family protein phosphatase [Pseudomonas oligotrophica]